MENIVSGTDIRVYTVTEINNEIKNMLEDFYPQIRVRGEISDFKLYSSGHMYFNIKDEQSRIKAVMFRSSNVFLRFQPQDGMRIEVYGRLSAYTARGDYQIIVDDMRLYGEGALYAAFEKLKKKLQREGLFDESAKKPVPELVRKIGVVTSKDGAALRDILEVLRDLGSGAEVLICPARVQGKEAEYEIAAAIKYLNENHKELDVLIVGRGGGSSEDLWAFNTEPVARAVFASEIPVISCVGHEIDFTIADFVSDLRAPTPSAAAEMAVRGEKKLKLRLDELKSGLFENMNFIIEKAESGLHSLLRARAFANPRLIYEDKIVYVDGLQERMKRSFDIMLKAGAEKINDIMHKLDLISPLSVLKRGYSICKDAGGSVVKDSSSLSAGGNISIKFAKGAVKAIVSGEESNA